MQSTVANPWILAAKKELQSARTNMDRRRILNNCARRLGVSRERVRQLCTHPEKSRIAVGQSRAAGRAARIKNGLRVGEIIRATPMQSVPGTTVVAHSLAGFHACDADFRLDLPAVYFLVSRGRVVYVGQTKQLFARLNSHTQNGRGFDYAMFNACRRETLLDVERTLK